MRNLFIIMCLLASVGLQAQTIKGRVMEETEDGEVALPGANVYWVGTSKGSVSDAVRSPGSRLPLCRVGC